MSFLCWVNARILGELLLLCIIVSLSGLILVIFFTELVGLAPHNFTEPGTKTMSPVKMLCQILQAYQPGLVKAANDYMIWWWNKNYKDDSVCEKKNNKKLLKTWWFFTYFAQSAWAFWIHPINDRASRAQSSQNMRAREQNREHRARGLALKSGLLICLFTSSFITYAVIF